MFTFQARRLYQWRANWLPHPMTYDDGSDRLDEDSQIELQGDIFNIVKVIGDLVISIVDVARVTVFYLRPTRQARTDEMSEIILRNRARVAIN